MALATPVSMETAVYSKQATPCSGVRVCDPWTPAGGHRHQQGIPHRYWPAVDASWRCLWSLFNSQQQHWNIWFENEIYVVSWHKWYCDRIQCDSCFINLYHGTFLFIFKISFITVHFKALPESVEMSTMWTRIKKAKFIWIKRGNKKSCNPNLCFVHLFWILRIDLHCLILC